MTVIPRKAGIQIKHVGVNAITVIPAKAGIQNQTCWSEHHRITVIPAKAGIQHRTCTHERACT